MTFGTELRKKLRYCRVFPFRSKFIRQKLRIINYLPFGSPIALGIRDEEVRDGLFYQGGMATSQGDGATAFDNHYLSVALE